MGLNRKFLRYRTVRNAGVRAPYGYRSAIQDWDGPLGFRSDEARPINAALAHTRTLFHTPQVSSSLRVLKQELDELAYVPPSASRNTSTPPDG